MATWIEIEEFAKISGRDESEVLRLCESGELSCKDGEDGKKLVEVSSGTQLILRGSTLPNGDIDGQMISQSFVEKTIETILAFHEKVLDAKEEALESLRRENKFLKEGLISMQEIYDEDRKTIETLTKQLEATREELEFMKRKYKLMWDQTVENYANNTNVK